VNSSLVWNNVNVRNYNIFAGLYSFHTKGSPFNYAITVNNATSVSATSSNTWTKFGFNLVLFEYYYCPDATPYLMVTVTPNVCYDICPIRYCSNSSDFQCDKCPTYDCYYCGVNGKCISCNDTADFRYMDNTTMRCLPLPGYYDNGVSQAAPCAVTCLTCVTTSTKCLSCVLGKYLSVTGNLCNTCMTNCANCTSATPCITCNTYYIYTGGACQPNCSLVTHCSTCNVNSTGINCITCTSGYSVINNTCTSICGDSIIVTPEVCDDGNPNSGDGCSSTCQLEPAFACNLAVSPTLCTPCSSNCVSCTSNTTCTTCDTYYMILSTACVLNCSVVTQCSTCQFNASLPAPGTECLTCTTGFYVQTSDNTCITLCGDGKLAGSEACDDNGILDGDGCSSTCTI
jgi:cysteine-rich repeat protein